MRGKRPTWYMNSACSKMVLKMVENFLSLFDFQGGSLFLEKDEKNERDKIKKKLKKVT